MVESSFEEQERHPHTRHHFHSTLYRAGRAAFKNAAGEAVFSGGSQASVRTQRWMVVERRFY